MKLLNQTTCIILLIYLKFNRYCLFFKYLVLPANYLNDTEIIFDRHIKVKNKHFKEIGRSEYVVHNYLTLGENMELN